MTAPYLTISTRDDGLIAVDGEVDAANADRLDEALIAAGPVIRLDLASVSFIDSCGLHALMRARQRPGTTLDIVDSSATVRRLFELTGVSDILLSRGAGLHRTDDADR